MTVANWSIWYYKHSSGAIWYYKHSSGFVGDEEWLHVHGTVRGYLTDGNMT